MRMRQLEETVLDTILLEIDGSGNWIFDSHGWNLNKQLDRAYMLIYSRHNPSN